MATHRPVESKRCKTCHKADVKECRRPGRAKPGALVLVPNFPAAPAAVVEEPVLTAPGPRRASLVEETERTLATLDPPPGQADAAVVAALYRVARLLDDSEFGLERVKDAGTLMPKYVALLRELKATRSTAAVAPVKSERRRAASY